MTRAIRRFAAILALGAFAFAQIAVSAHACPMAMEPRAHAQPEPGAEGCCPQLSTPNLCERHCAYGSASVGGHADAVGAPDLAALPWGVVPVDVADPPSHVPARHLARSTAPPPPARPLPLRI